MTPEKNTPVEPSPPTIEHFKKWAEGRPGLPPIVQLNEYAAEFNLTPEERTTLSRELGIKEPEPGKPIPTRPRAKVLADFLAYAKGKTGFQISQLIAFFAYYYKLSGVELQALKEDVGKIQLEEQRKEEEKRKAEEKKEEEKRKAEEKKAEEQRKAEEKKEEEQKKKEEEKRRKEEEEKKRKEEEERKKKPVVKPELVIERTPYPKWWKDSLNAKIDFAAPGSQILATVTGSLRLFVSVIVITVTGETQITITFGNAGSSGPLYLGGENQPMGMVIAMGNSPAPCGNGSLEISATDPGEVSPSIGGWATCFVEEVIKQRV